LDFCTSIILREKSFVIDNKEGLEKLGRSCDQNAALTLEREEGLERHL
jgi:hypothetical protein